jgi:hypothetical protein
LGSIKSCEIHNEIQEMHFILAVTVFSFHSISPSITLGVLTSTTAQDGVFGALRLVAYKELEIHTVYKRHHYKLIVWKVCVKQ